MANTRNKTPEPIAGQTDIFGSTYVPAAPSDAKAKPAATPDATAAHAERTATGYAAGNAAAPPHNDRDDAIGLAHADRITEGVGTKSGGSQATHSRHFTSHELAASADAPKTAGPRSNEPSLAPLSRSAPNARPNRNRRKRKTWDPEMPSPDLEPLLAPPMPPGPDGTARPHAREYDVTRRLLGHDGSHLPHFDDDPLRPPPPELDHLALLGRIDLDATLTGYPDGRPFVSGQLIDGEWRRTNGLPKIDTVDVDILSALDRTPVLTAEVLHRYAAPELTEHGFRARLRKLLKYGLIEFTTFKIKDHHDEGPTPRLYRPTHKGWRQVLKPRLATRRLSFERPALMTRAALDDVAHDIGVVSYVVAVQDHAAGPNGFWAATGWADAHITLPNVLGADGRRRPIEPRDYNAEPFEVSDLCNPTELHPDAIVELLFLTGDGRESRIRLFIEYDRKGEVPHILGHLERWSAARHGWLRQHPHYQHYGWSLPGYLIVCRDHATLLRYLTAADRALKGCIGVVSEPAARYFAARENLYFALEDDIYHGSLRAFQLPWAPPGDRRQNGQPFAFRFHRAQLLHPLPDHLRGKLGRGWRGEPWRAD